MQLFQGRDADSGSITVDGKDIREIERNSLRKAFTMVLQDTWLFNGTIFDNIAYGKEGATLEEVKHVAKEAMIDGFIESLPDGYDTVITDDGINISKGQRQLITIARAMLADAKMLILDEATSNVDSRTEIKIQEAMTRLMKDKLDNCKEIKFSDTTVSIHSVLNEQNITQIEMLAEEFI